MSASAKSTRSADSAHRKSSKKPRSGRPRPKGDGSFDAVKVAVRVRPFSQRELDKGAKLCVEMNGNQTTVIDVSRQKANKSFSFDYSYWSHDGFETTPEGIHVATDDRYIDQERVFKDLGRGVLDNAMQGYNAALFAYGQTGSGKSHTMIGYGPNKGVVPILCENIFKRIKKAAKNVEYQVSFSMLEIYNERVRDLLSEHTPPGGLKIRQHPKHGFTVYGLTKVAVSSAHHVLERMEMGNIARTTASTQMNETSSRSHMVITLHMQQVLNKGSQDSTTKTSEIHLVDLAGSERAETSGTSSDRLQEGSAINQSLSCLGNVISALADISSGKTNVRVPYRDSALTKLLHNALGGNSRTIMISAISPSSTNYEETVSTLRYADRAKQIQCNAVVNESPTDKLIRELKEENDRLMKLIKSGQGGEDALAANQNDLKNFDMAWSDRLAAAEKEWKRGVGSSLTSKRSKGAFLENVNEDPQLSGVIIHQIQEGKTLVARKAEGVETPEGYDHTVLLGGLSIQKQHATFVRKGKKVMLYPGSDGMAQVLVNGKRLLKDTTLRHNDRIVLAPNHLYKFVACADERTKDEHTIDFDFIQTEIAAAQGLTQLADGGTSSNLANPDLRALREDVIYLLPMVAEANAISDELQRAVVFDLIVRSGASHDLTDKTKQVLVKVVNRRNHHVWHWSKAKFINRKYLMQEMYEAWVDGAYIQEDKQRDPFWDPPEDIFLGSAYLYLQSLAYHIDIDETLSVTNYQGQEEGKIHVGLCPCDATGRPLSEDMFVSNPTEQLGKRMDLLVKVMSATDIKWVEEDPTRGVSCLFKFYTDTKKRQTKIVTGKASVEFGYSKQFTIKSVSHNFVNYLEHNALVVEMWGKQGTGQPPSGSPDALDGLNGDALDKSGIDPNFLEERRFLLQTIEELKAELEYMRVEKMALEKDLTRISLKTGDTFMQKKDPGMDEGVEVLFQDFLKEDQILRERLDELTSSGEKPPKQEIQSVRQACDFQAKRVGKIEKELKAMVDTPRSVLNALAKKK